MALYIHVLGKIKLEHQLAPASFLCLDRVCLIGEIDRVWSKCEGAT